MEPWQNWAIVGLVGIGAYYYYSQSSKSRRGRRQAIPPTAQTSEGQVSPAQNSIRSRKRKIKSSSQQDQSIDPNAKKSSRGFDESAGRKQSTKPQKHELQAGSSEDPTPKSHEEPTQDQDDKEDLDNRAFAQKMAGVRTGASLARRVEEPRKPKRHITQEHLGTPALSPDMSRTGSTTGAEADDDTSSAASPDFGAARAAGDVSDMLEAPGKGSSVIRLTGLPEEKKKVYKPKVEEPAETKKQRQRRRQKEELKEFRAETEKERRVKLENQLRTARIAEGRPAKNGLASTQSPVPSVWTNTANGNIISAPSDNVALLDTFDNNEKQKQKIAPEIRKDTELSASDKAWEQEYRSEEEQMRLLNEIDGDGWNTVEKGGKAKKKKANTQTNSSGAGSVAATEDEPQSTSSNERGDTAQEDFPSTVRSKAPVNGIQKRGASKEDIDPNVWNHSNIHNHPDYDPHHPWALVGHPEDSDWAVV